MKTVIATWMYSAPSGDESMHHQVGASIGKQKIKNIYWRCCFNLFRSAKVSNPDAECYLFCNEMPPEQIDGQATKDLLEQFGVSVHILSSISRPDIGYYEAWNTQFIVFDILDELKKLCEADDVVMILDSDCILSKKISPRFIEKVQSKKALLYTLDGSWEAINNGLSNQELSQVAQEYSPPSKKKEVFYTGGEIICMVGEEIEKVVTLGKAAYKQSLERSEQGQSKFNEEAHMLSYVYGVLNYDDHTANEFIRRIWTDPFISRTCYGDEIDLLIWHLPAEKKTSLKKLFALGEKADGLMRDKRLLADFLHVNKSKLFWVHFIARAIFRSIIRCKRKIM